MKIKAGNQRNCMRASKKILDEELKTKCLKKFLRPSLREYRQNLQLRNLNVDIKNYIQTLQTLYIPYSKWVKYTESRFKK